MKKLILGISACVFVFGLFLQPDIALANSNSTESAPKAHITIQGVDLTATGKTLSDASPVTGGTNNEGLKRIGAIVQAIFNYIVIITISLAVMMIIVGGIQYMTGNVDDGKERIKNALVGLLLLLFTGALLHLINPGFFTG